MEAATGSQGPFSGHLPTLLAMRPSGMPPAFSCRPASVGSLPTQRTSPAQRGQQGGTGPWLCPSRAELALLLGFPSRFLQT